MAGGVINTGSHPKALWPGVKAWWGQVYNEYPDEYVDLFDVQTSEQAYEELVQITGFGLAPVKTEGGSGTYDTETQGFTVRATHIAYALGFKVTYEELKDNLYPVIAKNRAAANAFSMRQTVENVTVAMYNDAFTGSVFLYPDGQPLISDAHVNVTGGTFSNEMVPGADLSEVALEDINIQLMQVRNDRGLLISVMGQSLHVAPQEWYNANRIMKSIQQPGTANNDINVLKATNAFPKGIKLNHYFSNPSAWFVRTNVQNGMIMYWRERPDFMKDNDFDTRNAKAMSYMRLSATCGDPRSIFGSLGP